MDKEARKWTMKWEKCRVGELEGEEVDKEARKWIFRLMKGREVDYEKRRWIMKRGGGYLG